MAIGKIEILDMRGAKVGVGIKSIDTYYIASENGTTPPELVDVDLDINSEGILGFTDVSSTFSIENNLVFARQNDSNLLLTIDQNLITGVGDWTDSIPEVPEGWFLWTKTIQTLTDNRITVSYAVFKQGERGPQGKDASTFYFEINQPEILMFKKESEEETGAKIYDTIFAPEILVGSIWEKDLSVETGKSLITLVDSDKEFFKLYLYDSKEFIEVDNIIEIEGNQFKINTQKLLQNSTQETILKIIFNKIIDDKKIDISSYLTVRFGISADMANLSVSAGGIVGAIQNTKLIFNSNGLIVQNGGLEIRNNSGDSVLYANNYGNLTLKGYVEAFGGKFSGDISGSSGTFSGSITGASGTIGGFLIEKGRLISISIDNGTPLIELNGEQGIIKAKNIELGTGATIKDFIKLGENVILKNPKQVSEDFISVSSQEGIQTLSINSTGLINIGNEQNRIILHGPEGIIYSANYKDNQTGWQISNKEAIFNNIVARGELKAAVFSYGETQAIGGTLIVRPSGKVAQISVNEENNTFEVTMDSYIGFNIGDWCLFDNGQRFFYKIRDFITEEETIIGLVFEKTEEVVQIESFIGKPIINFGKTKSVGISINGSEDNSFATSNAISIFEFDENKRKINPKIILGKVPDENIYGAIKNTYGLYAENALLKGSLITKSQGQEDGPIYCGINTVYTESKEQPTSQKYTQFFGENNFGNILFWAGAKDIDKNSIEDSPFLIDERGNLIAKSGYFKGSIITDSKIVATEIETAVLTGPTIEGNPSAALTIKDASKGIIFENLGTTIFSLGEKAIEASIPKITFNKYFKIDDKGAVFTPKIYATNSSAINGANNLNSSEAILIENNKIKYLNIESKDLDNLEIKSYLDFSSGFKFIPEGLNNEAFTINNSEVRSNIDLYIGQGVKYSEKAEYKPVYNNGEIIGYDLYLK